MEQARHGHRAFDIAAHFTNFGDCENDYDISLYPSCDTQNRWLEKYMTEERSRSGQTFSQLSIQTEVVKLKREISVFRLVRHLQATIHALVMVMQPRYNSYGQMQIALQRIKAFHLQKHEILHKI